MLSGTVSELYESGVLLTGDPLFDDVIVHLDGASRHVYIGMPLTVYYDGVMAMSLPGQVNALYTIVPELAGTVSERDEDGFTLTDADGESYRVLVDEETLVGVLSASYEEAAPDDADASDEAGEDASLPDDTGEDASEDAEAAEADEAADKTAASDDTGEDASEDTEADASDEDADKTVASDDTDEDANDANASDDGEDVEASDDASLSDDGSKQEPDGDEPLTEGPDVVLSASTLEWGDGDNVIVYYNGSMTKSLPPQLHALEVLVIR